MARTRILGVCTLLLAACSVPRTPVPEGINAKFLEEGPIREWELRWEVESRDIFRARKDIVPALNLSEGDVGAGTGLFIAPLSKAVGPTGKVFAVDIAPKFVAHLSKRAEREGLSNVEAVLSTDKSVTLPDASVDAVFLCDVYHHFEYHTLMLESIHRALRPGGQFVVIDFERIPGVTRKWLLGHVRAGKEVFRAEIEAAGFELAEEVEMPSFRENYFLRFTKR